MFRLYVFIKGQYLYWHGASPAVSFNGYLYILRRDRDYYGILDRVRITSGSVANPQDWTAGRIEFESKCAYVLKRTVHMAQYTYRGVYVPAISTTV